MKAFYEKNRHLLPFALYMLIYLTWFAWLEDRHIWRYQIIHVFIDDSIPFCELFVIPYFLWFAYIPAVVLYLAANAKDEYWRSAIFLCTGMTVFLVVSTLFPNCQHLRPKTMPRDNILTGLVSLLYKTDTATNLWPSIHVFNSIGAHIALRRSQLGEKRWIRFGSFLLCISIILATMFIKQHSVFDVATAFVMAGALYAAVYRFDCLGWLRSLRITQRVYHPLRRRTHKAG